MKLDILCFAAHPDDVELACSGTVLRHIKKGYSVGIIDLTQGELGTRGSAELRLQEATYAAKILGVSVRENLNLGDGFFENNRENKLAIIEKIREYHPTIILANAVNDRHIDHGRGAEMVNDACFLSGLRKIETGQEPWRPKAVYHYIQDQHIEPDFCVDITEEWDKKIEAIKAFSSQFYDPKSNEPISPIATEDYWHFLEGRARHFGRPIGAKYAEAFNVKRWIGVDDLLHLQ